MIISVELEGATLAFDDAFDLDCGRAIDVVDMLVSTMHGHGYSNEVIADALRMTAERVDL